MIASIIVFLNILFIELILSVDNAAVLAVIVNKKLSDPIQRSKAIKYGIIGAYVFRGLSLIFVSWILYNPSIGAWFKIIGGAYLCYLFYTHLTPESDSVEEGNTSFIDKIGSILKLSTFWTTVIAVEVLDMAFSADNLVACVALSSNIYIVCGAVFIGILGMRFVAQYFSKLLEKFPNLEKSAFIVILLLGIKMMLGGIFDFFPTSYLHKILNHHSTDLVFSAITLGVFLIPILFKKIK